MSTNAPHKMPPVVKMEPAIDKLVESILYLVDAAAKRGYKPTQYDIVKSLFFADKSHLNRYGRPITFDNYVAMENGPVPSLAYELLKGEVDLKSIGLVDLPWTRLVGAHHNPKACLYINAAREPSPDVLSESDMEALSDALATVISLTFSQIRTLTHIDAAYVSAWGNGESNNSPMSYGMLFETPDFEEAEHLQYISQHR